MTSTPVCGSAHCWQRVGAVFKLCDFSSVPRPEEARRTESGTLGCGGVQNWRMVPFRGFLKRKTGFNTVFFFGLSPYASPAPDWRIFALAAATNLPRNTKSCLGCHENMPETHARRSV